MGRTRLRLAIRLVKLMRRAQRGAPLPTIPELAREQSCSERSILRDLRALREAGVTIRRADPWEDAA